MTVGTIGVLVILISIVGGIIYGMIKDVRAGKSIQCGTSCASCHGVCHAVYDENGVAHCEAHDEMIRKLKAAGAASTQ